jgi:hypothetical protein
MMCRYFQFFAGLWKCWRFSMTTVLWNFSPSSQRCLSICSSSIFYHSQWILRNILLYLIYHSICSFCFRFRESSSKTQPILSVNGGYSPICSFCRFLSFPFFSFLTNKGPECINVNTFRCIREEHLLLKMLHMHLHFLSSDTPFLLVSLLFDVLPLHSFSHRAWSYSRHCLLQNGEAGKRASLLSRYTSFYIFYICNATYLYPCDRIVSHALTVFSGILHTPHSCNIYLFP